MRRGDLAIVNQTWRRQPCLADCGAPVKRARDSWVEFLGTRSGRWISAQVSASQMYADPLPPPPDEVLTILGFAHKPCFDRALELLRQRGPKLALDNGPEVFLEWGEHLGRFDFGVPAGRFDCPFCQFPQAELTDEDIVPRWMIIHILKLARLDTQSSRRLKREITTQTSVCRDCNNTWMSTLENDVQRILIPMFEQTRALDQGEQTLLARWATLKALLLDRESNEPIVPRGFGHDLKFSQLPHIATRVWIAAYSDPVLLRSELRPIFDPGERSAPIGLCATFAMVRVAFQVLIPFVEGQLGALENFNGSVVRLWPLLGETIDWPPNFYFDNDSFDALSVRINDNREDVHMEVILKRADRIAGNVDLA